MTVSTHNKASTVYVELGRTLFNLKQNRKVCCADCSIASCIVNEYFGDLCGEMSWPSEGAFIHGQNVSRRIISYSDLHLEFGSGWMLPPDANGDVMILAGDIITIRKCDRLDHLLRMWRKPVLYVTGNHEYYTRRPMNEEDKEFKEWLARTHRHVKLLLDEEVSIGGVNFFGGTMWTDFNAGDVRAMEIAYSRIFGANWWQPRGARGASG